MKILIIYLIGYILSYYTGRYYIKKEFPDDWTWNDVFLLLLSSLGSYLSFLLWTMSIISRYSSSKSKPPKWL